MIALFALCSALLAGGPTRPAPAVNPAPAVRPASAAVKPAPPPAFEYPEVFDFSIPVRPWSAPDAHFDTGAGHWTLIFYFSPTCGHCHKAWPEVENWNRKYSVRGFVFEAVSSGYASKEDLDWFAKDFGPFNYPTFQDTGKVLAKFMHVQSVPMFFLIDPYGGYRHWTGASADIMDEIESTIQRELRWRTGHI